MDLEKNENDFTAKEQQSLDTFISNGCMGLDVLVQDEHKVNSMFSLYMAGKNYTEISKITKVKKDLVLYMSKKMTWYEKRMDYLDSIQNKIVHKLANTRTESLNFITDLINLHHKFYGEEINRYLQTGDRGIIEDLDLKPLAQYFKSIEILEKILNPTNVNPRGEGKKGTTININTSGGEVKQVNEEVIEITSGTTGDILKKMAEIKDKQKEDE
jgi:hypothetical protein